MQAALRTKTTVLPGGRIEVEDAQLPCGLAVEVIVLLPEASTGPRPSITDVLSQAPGHLAFSTAEEVDEYIRQEREAWDR